MNPKQFEEIKKLMQPIHVEHHQPVSAAANNPMVWMAFVGTLIIVIGCLGIFIYNFQQSARDNRITKIETNFENVQSAQSKILEDQRLQSQTLKTLSEVITDLSATVSDMRSDRFRPTDFQTNMLPYEQRLQIAERELEKRTQTVNDVRDIKNDVIDMKEEFSEIKQRLLKLEVGNGKNTRP